MQSQWLEYCKEILCIPLGRQNGYVLAPLIVPILAVGFLGLVVRAASPAVDPALAKNGVIAQVQQRLNEIQQRSDVPRSGLTNRVETALTEEQPSAARQEDSGPSAMDAPPPQPGSETPGHESRQSVYFIKPGETFGAILDKEGLPSKQTASWLAVAQNRDEIRRLQIGRTIAFSYEHDQKGRTILRNITYRIDKRSSLVLEKDEQGRVEARVETKDTKRVWRAVSGRITHSLDSAARKRDVPASIVHAVAGMDWRLSLSSEIQRGATFQNIFLRKLQRRLKQWEFHQRACRRSFEQGQNLYGLFS